jgi:hypothetical protein
MTANYKMVNFAGYDDYYKSIDYGVDKELKRAAILNSDGYLFDQGVQNYYLGTPRVLTKKTNYIPNLDKQKVKNK